MLERGEVTASQLFISNANEYFCQLTKLGFCISRWVVKNGSRFKLRSIPPDKIKEVEARLCQPTKVSQSRREANPRNAKP